jgi:hypothetical protein
MKIRGLLIGILLAMVAAYFIFFTKVADDKGGLEIMVDKYLQAKIDLTAVNLESISRQVLTYAADGQGLPESLDVLGRSRPMGAAVLDAWGRKIRYERLSDTSFRLRSAGPDGSFETEDDIVKEF